MSLTSNYTTGKRFSFLNGSSKKKRTSISKKRIRKKIWKRKGYWTSLKAFSLEKSLSTGNSKSFFVQQNK